jgi:hypothetical protein
MTASDGFDAEGRIAPGHARLWRSLSQMPSGNEREHRHVFISYVREDADSVDKLATALERAGVEGWRDRDRIAPGARWQQVILVRISFLAYGDPSPKRDWRREGSEHPSIRSPASGDLGSDVVQMRRAGLEPAPPD